MRAGYWLAADDQGWSAAGVLAPKALGPRVGATRFLAAAPSLDVVLAWAPDAGDLDRIMAVGAREMFEQQRGPVSPRIFAWTGSAWVPYGEAVPKD